MSANTADKQAPRTYLADWIYYGGICRAPLADKRPDLNARASSEIHNNLNMHYVRADGREFRTRMLLVQQLSNEYHMRALMNKFTLNEMLSLYCGNQMSRNALLICYRICAFAQ